MELGGEGSESVTVGAEINLKLSRMGPNRRRLGSNRREWVRIGNGGSRNKTETVANGSESVTTGFESLRIFENGFELATVEAEINLKPS